MLIGDAAEPLAAVLAVQPLAEVPEHPAGAEVEGVGEPVQKG